MSASTSTKLIKIRIIAATNEIEHIAAELIAASENLELLEKSKLYMSRGNVDESRIYLTFRQKDIIDNTGGAQPRPGDLVKGS